MKSKDKDDSICVVKDEERRGSGAKEDKLGEYYTSSDIMNGNLLGLA